MLFLFAFAAALQTNAGGLYTNTNQSALYTRSMVRDASTDIDAVFYNPAGLTQLGDGLYFSLNNQTILQDKTVESDYNMLNISSYDGKVNAPLFPGIYGAFVKGKLAVSFGFNPLGGGGGAEFGKGLPSFEYGLTTISPVLQSSLSPIDQAIEANTGNNPGFSNVSGYNADVYFEGTSVFYGIQAGASYEISDVISVFAGGRYIMAKNTYDGYLKNITVNTPAAYGGAQSPGNYLRTVANNVDQATAAQLNATADALDAQTADKEVDAVQEGRGITPIIGVNVSPTDNLNIGIKYEFITKIELENDTEQDLVTGTDEDGNPVSMFPDGEKSQSDIPAMLSIGSGYKVNDKLTIDAGFHYFFDKSADYGKEIDGEKVDNEEVIDNNYWEFGIAPSYQINEKLLVSLGYLRAQSGVNYDTYNNDISYSNPSNSIGIGGKFNINPDIALNFGVSYTMYEAKSKTFDPIGTGASVEETYDKDALIFGLGVDIALMQ